MLARHSVYPCRCPLSQAVRWQGLFLPDKKHGLLSSHFSLSPPPLSSMRFRLIGCFALLGSLGFFPQTLPSSITRRRLCSSHLHLWRKAQEHVCAPGVFCPQAFVSAFPCRLTPAPADSGSAAAGTACFLPDCEIMAKASAAAR
jgi:hypothetical protein